MKKMMIKDQFQIVLLFVIDLILVAFWTVYTVVDLMKPVDGVGLACHSIMLICAIWLSHIQWKRLRR